MKNLPNKVNIDGKSYEVKFVEPCGLDCHAAGIVRSSSQVIIVDKTCCIERQKEVLLHEIIHAIDWAKVINLGEDNTVRLAGSILSLIKNNQKIIKWIIKADECNNKG